MKRTISADFILSKELMDKPENSVCIRRMIRSIQEDLRKEHGYIHIEYLDHHQDDYSFAPDYKHYTYTVYFEVE